MGRSTLSTAQQSLSTMSPMPFIVILLVMGSIKAMPNPQEMNTDEDLTPPTEPESNPSDPDVIYLDDLMNTDDDLTPPNGPTAEDLADNAVPENNDNKPIRVPRAPWECVCAHGICGCK